MIKFSLKNTGIVAITFVLVTRIVMGYISHTKKTNAAPDDVIGVWISDAQDSRMEILKSGNTYTGKLLAGWGNEMYEDDGETLRKDSRNSDPKLRSRPLLNMEFISGLVFADGGYKDGKLYVPQMGRTVRCKMWFDGNTLHLRMYAGVPLFGITKRWSRVQ
jgi:uncharacterized protein (DUF2147 family)